MASFFANVCKVGNIGGGGLLVNDIAGRPRADSRLFRRASKLDVRARVCVGLYAGE